MSAPALTLDSLVVGYRGRPLLPPLDAEVHRGQLWALIGRNGSGKSTLLKTLLGLLAPIGGALRWGPRVPVSFVPQRGDYEDAMPARAIDIIRAGTDRGWSFLDPFHLGKRRGSVRRAVADAGAIELLDEPFGTLSEGQKQRVWIARALASDPGVVLLDEPTSALDAVAERAAFELLDRLRRDRGLAVLLASHHMAFVPEFATHAILVDRDDRVAMAGPVDEVVASPTYRRHYGASPSAESTSCKG